MIEEPDIFRGGGQHTYPSSHRSKPPWNKNLPYHGEMPLPRRALAKHSPSKCSLISTLARIWGCRARQTCPLLSWCFLVETEWASKLSCMWRGCYTGPVLRRASDGLVFHCCCLDILISYQERVIFIMNWASKSRDRLGESNDILVSIY